MVPQVVPHFCSVVPQVVPPVIPHCCNGVPHFATPVVPPPGCSATPSPRMFLSLFHVMFRYVPRRVSHCCTACSLNLLPCFGVSSANPQRCCRDFAVQSRSRIGTTSLLVSSLCRRAGRNPTQMMCHNLLFYPPE